MKQSLVKRFLERVAQVRILVVGDLMIDEYLWGCAERISPEAPVPVVDVVKEDLRPGGAGNVINNLRTLGCFVQVLSVIGGDSDGERLVAMLGGERVLVEGVAVDPQRLTSRKTRILAGHQQMMRIDREQRRDISPEMEKRLAALFCDQLPDCHGVVISDYGKGVLTPGLLAEMIRLARDRKVPLLVDPKGRDFDRYRGAAVLTPNRKELLQAADLSPMTDANLRLAGHRLVRSLGLEALVLTRSEEGMTLFFRDGSERDLPTQAREVFDVSGAGDTVLAFLGAAMAAGLELAEAAWLANLAAGIAVGKVGTSTVAPAELLGEERRQLPGGDAKIQNRAELAEIAAAARTRGKKVVFTNGCFDLLHVGHVRYLQQARELGDLLILGLNSDASVRRLKGEKRPLIGEEERAHILAALGCVDFVTVFEEDSPRELIAALRPDILVKGGDYAPEEVVGRDLVEGYGGRVEIIRFVEGRSTTALINRILERF
ncbi:MAG: bifunctional D-glycero-beta-D-manno-heptose-7-phosphate kinase/D-glycero-beta-D-manno-heptose 1-phosphate adenylyltransferase HldE [Deltaproteobacteria bacterium]|nr:bifunctional D-glycero-beta-D-manno-heptose-7-phosphate kinase/D-glycero-beta-D-manno-heptose 1-phosphate adenylyltransferase HldE [Deltaproteobacteria bacterium]